MSRQSGLHRLCDLLVVLAIVVQVGCGKARPKTFYVEGQVTFPDNTPLTAGSVEFRSIHPGSDGLPYVAQGNIDEEGYFVLRTFEADDGAVPGDYEVIVIQASRPPPMPGESIPPPDFDPKYSQRDKSGLRFTVLPESNFAPLVVTKAASTSKP